MEQSSIKEILDNRVPKHYYKIHKIDLSNLVYNYPPVFKKGKFRIDIAELILSDMIYRADKNGSVIINSKKASKRFYNYLEYIRWFMTIRIIINKKNYRKNHYSISYTLEKSLFDNVTRQPIKTGRMSKEVKKLAELKLPEQFVIKNHHLFKGFNRKLSFSEELTNSILKNMFTGHNSGEFDQVILNKNVKLIQRISSDTYHSSFKLDDFGNRFYSILSNMHKTLRNYLRYENQCLYSIDIKNSLPLCLNFLLENPEIKNVEDIYKIIESRSIMFDILLNPHHTELSKYKQLTSSGLIYEELGNYLCSSIGENYAERIKCFCPKTSSYKPYNELLPSENYIDNDARNRKICKDLLIKHLCSKNRIKEVDAFYRQEFPHIFDFINRVKEKNHKNISKYLQKIESILILEIITKEFCHENPSAIVFTIHDCIATQLIYAEKLKSKVMEVYSRVLTIKPTLHEEIWNHHEKLAA